MQREQPFGSWKAPKATLDAEQDLCSWLMAIASFSVAAFGEVNLTSQTGEGRMLRTHCQSASPSLWD